MRPLTSPRESGRDWSFFLPRFHNQERCLNAHFSCAPLLVRPWFNAHWDGLGMYIPQVSMQPALRACCRRPYNSRRSLHKGSHKHPPCTGQLVWHGAKWCRPRDWFDMPPSSLSATIAQTGGIGFLSRPGSVRPSVSSSGYSGANDVASSASSVILLAGGTLVVSTGSEQA